MDAAKQSKVVQGSANNNRQRMIILGGVIAIAVVIAVVAIVFSTSSAAVRGAKFDYSQIPQSVTSDGAHVLGDPNAPITIVEFADFRCPHCQTYTSTIERVIEDYVATGQAKLEYRYFITTDRAEPVGFSSRLTECAVEQDANFWVAHDVMFDLTSRGWTQTSAQQFAERLDISYTEMLNCTREARQFEVDSRLGQSAGVSGTPAIRVRLGEGGPLQPISPQHASGGPPYTVLSAAIEQANS